MSFKMAKIIVVVTIIEFCKGGAHIWMGEGRLILLDYVHMGSFMVPGFRFQFSRARTYSMSL